MWSIFRPQHKYNLRLSKQTVDCPPSVKTKKPLVRTDKRQVKRQQQRIIRAIGRGYDTRSALVRYLQLDQDTVSRRLASLVASGQIKLRYHGRSSYYSLTPQCRR